MILRFLLLIFCAYIVSSDPALSLTKCSSKDEICVTKAVKTAFPLILEENKSIGADNLDPMFLKVIEGNLSIIKYHFYNATITGYKSCEVENAKFNEEESITVVLVCPKFLVTGWYDINGQLVILPVQGNGDFVLKTKKYRLAVTMDLKTIERNGKSYMNVKKFRLTAEPLEPVYYDFRNLFNGNKQLGDIVLKYANENWADVADAVQIPVFNGYIKKIISNANKYLKTLSIDQYVEGK